jgi:translation initiation factor 3 subunit D
MCGALEYYDKSYDRITTKSETLLAKSDVSFVKFTTTDDPVIRQLVMDGVGNVFATDTILSFLMTATRSVYSWDVVVTRVGTKLFFDKRDGSSIGKKTNSFL